MTKSLKKIILWICIIAGIEVVLFNYKYFITMNNQPVQVPYEVAAGMEKTEDGMYLVTDNSDVQISIHNEKMHVNAIQTEIYQMEGEDYIPLKISYRVNDDAHSIPLKIGERTIDYHVSRSTYTYIHMAGDTDEILLTPEPYTDNSIIIKALTLNPVIPFHISLIRILMMLVFLAFMDIFWPKGQNYLLKVDKKSRSQRMIVLGLVIVESLFICVVANINKSYIDPGLDGYQDLAVSITEGHLYLDEEAPSILATMENPYDREARDIALKEANSYIRWDSAYYQGKYYWYFGVVPCILLYLPFYLLTHASLTAVGAVSILGIGIIIAITALLRCVVEKWYPHASFKLFILMLIAIYNGTGLLYCVSRPYFYDVPIMAGILFGLLGVLFWIKAKRPDYTLNKYYLALGSLCIALIAGCRPQLVLIAFIAFPLFWNELVQKRTIFSKTSMMESVMAVVPFLVIAAGLMLYNYLRFDSPFDFGANYNLTTNDMTHKVLSFEKIFQGTFTMLFSPVSIGLKFPYLQVASNWQYLGMLIADGTFGGLFMGNIVLWVLLVQFKIKNAMKEKQIWGICILLTIMGFLITMLDVHSAGILLRYYCDFAWLFYLAAVFVVFLIDELFQSYMDGKLLAYWRKALLIACLFTFIFNFFNMFTTHNAFEDHPKLYYTIRYLLDIWI